MKSILSKVLFLLAIAAAALSFTSSSRAQSTAAHLSTLEVDLWPEYDRPEMLVIVKMTLGSDVSLPAAVEVRVPANATIWATAELQVNNLVTVTYQERSEGTWKVISLTATVPEIQIEYYDPALTKNQDSRHYEYNWAGGFTVDNLGLEVQEPVEASNMKINPNLGNGQVSSSDGLKYYRAQVGALKQDQTFQATIDYTKSSDKLSNETINVEPAQPIGPDNAGRVTSPISLPSNVIPLIIAGAVGLAMIIGGATWYIVSSRKESEPASRRRRTSEFKESSQAPGDEAVYCQQCGKRAASGDRFCRQCGARLGS